MIQKMGASARENKSPPELLGSHFGDSSEWAKMPTYRKKWLPAALLAILLTALKHAGGQRMCPESHQMFVKVVLGFDRSGYIGRPTIPQQATYLQNPQSLLIIELW